MRPSKTSRARWLTSLCCGVLIGLGCEGSPPTAPTPPTGPNAPIFEGVRITSPSDGDMFVEGESVLFAATVMNDDGDDVSDGIDWISSRDGRFGRGPSFATMNLSVGTHEITAEWFPTEGTDIFRRGVITITITAAPVAPSLGFTKQFIDDPVVAGGEVMLEFTIVNQDPGNGVSGLSFSDDLDAVIPGLGAVDVPGADACGAGSEFTGTSVLTLEGGSLPPGGSCTFMVTLQVPETPGTFTNSTTGLSVGQQFGALPAIDDLIITPATLDGVYGPGRFTLDSDNCTPAFFPTGFDGTATISGGGTQLAIGGNDPIRLSNGSFVDGVGDFAGVGMVGSEAAGWDVELMFDANGDLVVTEQNRLLLRNNCLGTYISDPLQKE